MDTSAQTVTPQNRLVRRSAVRAAILDAARRLAAREGVEELSLTAVAAEAGFGQSTVFGHFRNKDELVLAILAEDLSGMATLMREHSLPLSQPEPDEQEVVAGGTVESFEATSESSADLALPEQYETAVADSASPYADKNFLSLVNGIHGERVESRYESSHEDTAHRPRVDAWLERRLRVFEHTLTDLERRLKESETSVGRAVTLAEQAASNVSDRVETFERQQTELSHSLLQRVEQAEQRQRGATAEMRAAMNDVATRIEILEAARRTQSRVSERVPSRSEDTHSNVASEPAAADDEAYTQAAQRAADAVAELANVEDAPAPTSAPARGPVPSAWRTFATSRVRVSRRQYVLAAFAALLAFVLGAFAAFYVGQAHGRELAKIATQRKPAAELPHRLATIKPAARKKVTQRSAAASPPDRVAVLAEAGNATAELLMGLRYLHGEGVAINQLHAAQWIRRAAEQHDPLAQYWMGSLYEQGNGVAVDSAEAVRWYEAAAGQGNRKAMHALGVAYAQGEGTQKDYSEAARWFAKAASLGLVNSQFNLAVLYERGLGVPQSLLDAYKWYAIAAAQGDRESQNRIEALKTQLNPDALAAAEGAAREFRPQAPDREANEPPVFADLAVGKAAQP